MATNRKIKWKDADFKWNLAPTNSSSPRYTWNDVKILQAAAGGPSQGDFTKDPVWIEWEEEKKKKLVKLILKVNGDTITESKQKEIKQYKIKASDIKITLEKVLGVEVITENIKF